MPVPLSSERRGGRAEVIGEGPLEAIEVAQGNETGEEGIVRLEDGYGRACDSSESGRVPPGTPAFN